MNYRWQSCFRLCTLRRLFHHLCFSQAGRGSRYILDGTSCIGIGLQSRGQRSTRAFLSPVILPDDNVGLRLQATTTLDRWSMLLWVLLLLQVLVALSWNHAICWWLRWICNIPLSSLSIVKEPTSRRIFYIIRLTQTDWWTLDHLTAKSCLVFYWCRWQV